MPSDLRPDAPLATPAVQNPAQPAIEPPSVKLIVRLFVIPFLIVAAAVGIMMLIGSMAGGTPSVQEAIARLKRPGGERTADWLVGPGAKQRYMDAKALTDQMKAGMTEEERVKLSGELLDLLRNYTRPEEGEVQHFVLLALGRVWQMDPSQGAMDSPAAVESRKAVMDALLEYAKAPQVATRKAAILAMAYWKGRDEARRAIPLLVSKLRDDGEDIDVRIAAATALGPLASSQDKDAIAALEYATRDSDPREVELVWSASLSLAELNQPQVADTILKLLSRDELSKMEYYDRESDPQNPSYRKLSDQEQQRILINTMIGVEHLDVPAVQGKLKELAEKDPSPRVRAQGIEILQRRGAPATTR